MAVKVYGMAISPPVLRVILCLTEKELEYELVRVSLRAGDNKKDSFISINPFGQIPGFEDGDLKLFESRAINKYISHKYADKGTQLISHDPKKLAIGAVWSEVEAQKFDVVAQKLAFELAVKPILDLITDDVIVAENEEKLAKVLDVYEARLGESKYLAGEDFSLADLNHTPVVNYLCGTKIKALFDARPHVSAWATSILARPAWSKVALLLKH